MYFAEIRLSPNNFLGARTPLDSLLEKFNRYTKTGTPAEKRLARYYLEHPEDLSFETAATVADRLDLSPMTVGRFLRGTGIDSHALPSRRSRSMTLDMAPAVTVVKEPVRSFDHSPSQTDVIQQVGAIRHMPAWRHMVEDISRTEDIYITAGGVGCPLAALFAWRLSEIRAGIRHVDGSDGVYLDILAGNRGNALVIALDSRAAHATLERLCSAARRAGHRVLCITAFERSDLGGMADLVVQLPASQRGDRLDPLAMTAMIELLANAVTAIRMDETSARARRIAELHAYFMRVEDGAT